MVHVRFIVSAAVLFLSVLVTAPSSGQVGACCFEDLTCQVLSEAECAAAGGVYWVEGEVCDPNPCIDWLGACCIPPTWECFMLPLDDCLAQEGEWFGEGTTCEPPP